MAYNRKENPSLECSCTTGGAAAAPLPAPLCIICKLPSSSPLNGQKTESEFQPQTEQKSEPQTEAVQELDAHKTLAEMGDKLRQTVLISRKLNL